MTIALDDMPRVDLGFLPTPLHALDRLSRELGGPRLWIKRDDCTGLATGGNKTRKLEFLIGDALQQNVDTVITFGAVQSNHARQTAAACAKFGLDCRLFLTRRVAWRDPGYEANGNVLLDNLLGAHVHLIEQRDVETASRQLMDDLMRDGRRCYVVPTGGSNGIGALGYVRCAAEIIEQSRAFGFQPDAVVHATSSGGTQAGLLCGLGAMGAACNVIGINVYDSDTERMERRVTRLVEETLQRMRIPSTSSSVRIVHDYLGEDYGIPTRQTIDAIRSLAALEGVLCDPVYSGKALGGLLDMVRRGALANHSNVVFIHTGGAATLPVYANAFAI